MLGVVFTKHQWPHNHASLLISDCQDMRMIVITKVMSTQQLKALKNRQSNRREPSDLMTCSRAAYKIASSKLFTFFQLFPQPYLSKTSITRKLALKYSSCGHFK